MSKAVRGTKRHCRSCGAKFYDLGRDPIVCPVCQSGYELAATSSKASVATAAVPDKPEADEEEEVVLTAAAGEPEFVSLEEAEDTNVEAEDDEDLADIDVAVEVDAEELPDDEDEDVFLEDDEEEGSDVSGIIGGGIKSEDER